MGHIHITEADPNPYPCPYPCQDQDLSEECVQQAGFPHPSVAQDSNHGPLQRFLAKLGKLCHPPRAPLLFVCVTVSGLCFVMFSQDILLLVII
jgi:hypothetical protein